MGEREGYLREMEEGAGNHTAIQTVDPAQRVHTCLSIDRKSVV